LRDRAGDPLQRVIILFGVKANAAHQMQRVRVIGIDGKHLLAAKLRVENLARLKVAKTGRQ